MFVAKSASQKAEVLATVARQARRRADKANEMLQASFLALEVQERLTRTNSELVEVEKQLKTAG
jgi:hypothetical protein